MANKIQFEHLQKWKKEQRKQRQYTNKELKTAQMLSDKFGLSIHEAIKRLH
jgi:hypothetical protein